MKLEADTVDAVPLVGRGGVAFPLEDVTQMTTAVATDDLGPFHAETAVGVPGHGTGDAVKVGRPPATGLELVVGLVKGCVASGASVDTGGRHVFVVFSGKRCFGTLFAYDTELICFRHKQISKYILDTTSAPIATATAIAIANYHGPNLYDIPLFNTALHSSSDRPSGYDIFSFGDELKKLPRNGKLGIDFFKRFVRVGLRDGDEKVEKVFIVVVVVVVIGPRSFVGVGGGGDKWRREVALLRV